MVARKWLWIIVSLMLGLALLSACGGRETNTPEGSGQPPVVADTATPAPPTTTATPAATPTPSADDRVALGVQQHEAGQLEEAAATFQEAIQLDPDHTDAYFQLGVVYYDLSQFEEAVGALEKAVALDPANPDAHRNLGTAYGELDEWEKAIAAYEKAIELKSDFGEAYGDLIGAYANTGQLTQAFAVGKRAIELSPDYITAYNNLGMAYGMQGDLKKAITLFEEALQIDPEYAAAHYNLGFAYESQKNLDQAITEYRHAIRIDPYYSDARENLGSILARQNQLDEAIAEWQALLEYSPERASTHRGLGMAYAVQGEYAEAIAAFETYLTLAPDASDKAAVEQEIATLNAKITEAETTYRNAAGGYSFPRPAGWYYEEDETQVKFSESAEALENAPDAAPVIMLQADPANELAADLDFDIDADAVTYLQALIRSAELEFAEPENVTIAGYPAALVAFIDQSPTLQGAMFVILVEGRAISGVGVSPPDQWEAFQPIFVATLQGLTFTLPEYRNAVGGYSLSYPGGWSYKEHDEMVTFALTKAALNRSERGALEEGMVIGLDVALSSELAEELKVENSADPEVFVTAMAGVFKAQVGNIETGEIGGYPAAYANISGIYQSISYTGGIVAIRVGENIVGVYAMAAPDLWGEVRPLLSDMLDSMTFFEPSN